MPFIKHGDGKIVGILDPEELTEEQKKSVKSKQAAAPTETDSSTKQEKKSGS